MRFGVLASLLFHGCLLGLAFLSLPESLRPDVAPEPFVPIELIADAEYAEQTSVPAASKEPEPEPVEEPDLEEVTEPDPVEPEPQAEVEPEPAPVESEPAPVPEKEEPDPEPKKEPEPKPEEKPDGLDFDRLAGLVDKAKEDEPAPANAPSQTTEQADQDRAAVGLGDRLPASDEAKIRAALLDCWTPPIGAPEAEKLVVEVEFELNRDGTLSGTPRVKNATQINLSGNRFWKVAEREAVNAVIKCQPYSFLSQERYEQWREMKFNFNPSEMLGL